MVQLVCGKTVVLKHYFCSWRGIQGKLLTKDILQQRNYQLAPICDLLRTVVENIVV